MKRRQIYVVLNFLYQSFKNYVKSGNVAGA